MTHNWMFYRAQATAAVHYRQYLYWMTAAHASDHENLREEWVGRAEVDRHRAADAVWIATGRR